MLEIATPISNLFNNADIAKKITSVSDCLECRERSVKKKYSKEYLMHFELNIIHPWDKNTKEYINSLIISKSDLKLLTFHMATSYDKVVIENGIYQPRGVQYPRAQLLSNAKNNIKWLYSFIDRSILIAVENNNYYPSAAYEYITDGDFIMQIVKDNGIYFLFDIAHARITAHNRGKSYEEYIAQLPIDRVIQLHVAKHGVNNENLAYDMHDLPNEAIFQEVYKIVKKNPVRYLTIEYYQDGIKLLKLLENYRRIKD